MNSSEGYEELWLLGVFFCPGSVCGMNVIMF